MALDRRDFLKIAGAQAGLLVATGACASTGGTRAGAPSPFFGAPAIGSGARDVIVIGAGVFGTWTALNLRQMGARVTLVDTWGPGNSRSTSGDETRGVRTSYGDREHGELWVRWASESITRWKRFDEEFAKDLGAPLYYTTGDLIMREDWEPFLCETRALWEKVGIPFESLPPGELAYRWPVIGSQNIGAVLYEPDAGVVRARASCLAVTEVFEKLGGEVVVDRVQTSMAANGGIEQLYLTNGGTLRADAYVYACGPWLPKIFPDLLGDRMRTPIGNVFYFATPSGDHSYSFPNIPSWNFPGVTGWPALPPDHRGFRVRTGGGGLSDPDISDRWIPIERHQRGREFLAQRFPGLRNAPINETRACHYELSISRNFIIDRHPDFANVWIAGGGSAEGFKFGPVIGEYVARRVLGDEGDPELAKQFRIPEERYEPPPPPAPPTPADTTAAPPPATRPPLQMR